MFDITLQVIHITVVGEEGNLELQLLIGMQIPGPDGQPAILPLGVVRTKLGRDISIATGKDMVEKGEELPEPPKPSNIVLPDNETVASVNQERHGSER